MTPKERAAMQQALIYLDAIINGDDVKPYQLEGTAFTLREALDHFRDATKKVAEQAEQEPVAWAHPSGGYLSARYMKEFATGLEKETHTIPLYAAPVRTKDLTDDDLEKTYDEICRNASSSERLLFRYGRAVIAADREKNNVK